MAAGDSGRLPHEEWEKPWYTAWAKWGRMSRQDSADQSARDDIIRQKAAAARKADGRPNILFIFTDQQTASAMSCTGNKYVNTPNMDRLAASGVRFARSYCTYPLCGPARSSLITGLMPSRTGVIFNETAPDPAIPNLGQVFRRAGYVTAWSGKWHLPESYVNTPDGMPGFDNLPLPGYPRNIYGLGDAVDYQFAMDAVCFLMWEARKVGLPWLYCVSLHNPHDICHWTRIRPARHLNIDRYPPLPANFDAMHNEPDYIRLERMPESGSFAELPRTLGWSGDQWRAYMHAYYHMTEQADRAIGLILDALEDGGWSDNTLVVFTSDHGDGCASHRWAAKNCLYEEPVAVPMILNFPGRIPPAVLDETHIVSGLDVMPTMCDYAGVKGPPMAGLSMKTIIENPRGPWRDFVVAEVASRQSPAGQRHGRMVRSGRYKYNVYDMGENNQQLFDLAKDPGETVNLAADPAMKNIIDAHRQMLKQWIDSIGDWFKLPE
ncbi:MAG: sulfatase-like hydrolase/transferase [Planctomycetes bacterium]|nr:sulfatase-like hydrolase/transferase [Planctomycetota bacterium]